MPEDEAIIVSMSPYGTLEAALLQDDRVAHFYIRGAEDSPFGVKNCWVRNLQEAPESFDLDGMQEGLAPLLPAAYCKDPKGQPPLSEDDDLEILWFPEGDGAALLKDGQYLAIIPPWSGFEGFHGYARDCKGESPLCWALQDDAHMQTRIKDAKTFWSSWSSENSPWEKYQPQIVDVFEATLGKHSRYFAIDGGYWPPKAIVQFDEGEHVYLFTVGLSLCPQPSVEMAYEEPAHYRRIEFGACLNKDLGDDVIMTFAKYLSAQSLYPWEYFTFFGYGHTLPCDAFADHFALSHLTFLHFLEAPHKAPQFNLPSIEGEPINLLWCVPITAKEQQLAEQEGAAALIEKFPNENPPCLIQGRQPVV